MFKGWIAFTPDKSLSSGQRYPLFKQPVPGCLFEAKTFNFFMKRVCSCLDLALTLVSENEIPSYHSSKVYQQYFNVELFRMLFSGFIAIGY